MDEQLLRIRRTTSRFFELPPVEPEPRHFNDWVNSMKEPLRTMFRRLGYNQCKSLPGLCHFIMERKDEGLQEYMMRHLSPQDYRFWKEHRSQWC
ncbi:hypothetical protein CLV24_1621 [Pontibacter ummariensis]|uniref:Uncharacterized protein n=1 Tax=Pontibacter ummariensis TaxID=1610492 RepID=A0A239M2Q1_9BACT|nr:hypothetical protein [Pontibacter ummariensis]PRX99265.1 hypothetical protein CLV24_1621 [Pontibacter ummariensis]SNT36224.1 hypothetical protein SAMN06296052_1631 [Pontibacter ummariensis]